MQRTLFLDSTPEVTREYYSQDLAAVHRSIMPDCVLSNDSFQVTSVTINGSSASANVRGGNAWFKGYFFESDEVFVVNATLISGTITEGRVYLQFDPSGENPVSIRMGLTREFDLETELPLATFVGTTITDNRFIYRPTKDVFIDKIYYRSWTETGNQFEWVHYAASATITDYFDGLTVKFYTNEVVTPSGKTLGGVYININRLGDKLVKTRDTSGNPTSPTSYETYKYYTAIYHGDTFYLMEA